MKRPVDSNSNHQHATTGGRADRARAANRPRDARAWPRWPMLAAAACLWALASGCGTTRSSDTMRTATEQILLSNAIDQAVNGIDFQALAGKEVYLDTERLKGVTDENYLTSTLRQHMLAQGCYLMSDKESAEYIVEARSGALGTNSHSLLFGVPAVNLPGVGTAYPGVPSSIPEIPFAKTTKQAGVAKIALFAYNRKSGRPVWQSGAFPATADAKNAWFFGLGPFQRGSIYDGKTKFAGSDAQFLPFKTKDGGDGPARPTIPVTAEAVFDEPPVEMASNPDKATASADDAAKSDAAKSDAAASVREHDPGGAAPAGHILRLPPTARTADDSKRAAKKR